MYRPQSICYTLDMSLCNTQAQATNLIPAILCDDEGVTKAHGC